MLLFITRKYPPSVGGMQRINYELIRHTRQLAPARVIAWGGSQAALPLFLPAAFLGALALLADRRVQCIHLGDGLLAPLGLLLRQASGRPVTISVMGRDISFADPLYQAVVPRCLARLDRVVCLSGYLAEQCRQRGVPAERCTVIPTGVQPPPHPGRPAALVEARLGRSLAGRRLLLTVARLVEKKGVHWFIAEVLPGLVEADPSLLYVVAGDGPWRERITAAIHERGVGDHAILLGDVPMGDPLLGALYHTADLFVMPNVPVAGDVEGFGVVSLEAASAGLPVVATRIDAIPEAITHGENGFLVRPLDPSALREAILWLLEDEEARRAFGERARRFTLERYSWPAIAARHLRLWQELAATPQMAR